MGEVQVLPVIHVHLVQRHGVLLHLGQDTVDCYKEQVLRVEEGLLLVVTQSLSLEWLQVVAQLRLQVRERATDAVHLLEAFIKIVAIPHEEAVERKHLNWL